MVAIIASLAGCRTMYSGWESDVDGVLWRQTAEMEDRIWSELVDLQSADDVEKLSAQPWDGVSDPSRLGIEEGAAVVYDVSVEGNAVVLSVFIASGPRPNRPTDDGDAYTGPSEIFTCFGYKGLMGVADDGDGRIIYTECPAELVALVPADAAFATDDVFDG